MALTQDIADTAPVAPPAAPPVVLSRAYRVRWTLAHLLLLTGAYLLLLVGGFEATVAYQRYAARGDTALPAPNTLYTGAVAGATRADAPAGDAVWQVPIPAVQGTAAAAADGDTTAAAAPWQSQVTRIVMPDLAIDWKVIPVGWEVQTNADGSEVAVWQVAEYAVGHHRDSANPGTGDNVVLAGHVGGYGKVFRDLHRAEVGMPITVYSDGTRYRYVVSEVLLVDEVYATPAQRIANAAYIAPQGEEMLTLVTCHPAEGDDRYTQRILVRALPVTTSTDN